MIIETTIDGQFTVKVTQDARRRTFAVTYGAEVKSGLTWEQAAREYGYCVFHAAQCAGLIEGGAA